MLARIISGSDRPGSGRISRAVEVSGRRALPIAKGSDSVLDDERPGGVKLPAAKARPRHIHELAFTRAGDTMQPED